MDPQAVIALEASPSHRSFAGHVLASGVYVFIFGGLAYLTFLNQGGVPGQLLLIYLSSLPLAIVIGTASAIARERQKLEAHHAIAGCLSAVLFCGVGGIWVVFGRQLIVPLLGSLAVVWLSRYSPVAEFVRPPTFADIAAPNDLSPHRSLRTWATLAGAALLLIGGITLSLLAVVGQMERLGGLHFTYGG